MTAPGWEVVETTEEEQQAVAGHRVHVRKTRIRVDGRLALLRKTRLDGPTGPKVVLVHGFAQNRYTWHSSVRSMSAWLADRGFDVYTLELRGHGHSRSTGGPERFEDYVEDMKRIIEILDDRPFLVGHSLGGAVAYAASTHLPVRGVVGIGAIFRFAQANRTIYWLCKASALIKARSVVGGLSVRTRLAGKLLGRLYDVSDVAGYAFPVSGWAPGSIEPEVLAERLDRGFDWTSLHVWLDMARWGSTGTWEYEEAWQKTEVPVLVMAGDLDHLMPPEDARLAYDLAGSPDRTWMLLDPWSTGLHWGHLDLVLGKEAPRWSWTPIAEWLEAR